MNKTAIGVGLIIVGTGYGFLAVDRFNQATLGYLLANGWIKAPKQAGGKSLFGPKLSIISISLGLVLVGIYIIIKQ